MPREALPRLLDSASAEVQDMSHDVAAGTTSSCVTFATVDPEGKAFIFCDECHLQPCCANACQQAPLIQPLSHIFAISVGADHLANAAANPYAKPGCRCTY